MRRAFLSCPVIHVAESQALRRPSAVAASRYPAAASSARALRPLPLASATSPAKGPGKTQVQLSQHFPHVVHGLGSPQQSNSLLPQPTHAPGSRQAPPSSPPRCCRPSLARAMSVSAIALPRPVAAAGRSCCAHLRESSPFPASPSSRARLALPIAPSRSATNHKRSLRWGASTAQAGTMAALQA